ncbi:MAG: hypothetical protein ACUVQT_09850 [bacterium]
MTLISGIVCRYNNKKCVLLTGDKALSYGSRILESPKIRQVSDLKIVMGEAGESSDLQRFYCDFKEELNNLLADDNADDNEQIKEKIVALVDLLLIKGMLLRKFNNATIDGEIIIGATDTKTTKLYHIYAEGAKALEIDDFVCIGSGAELIGTLMLKSIYNPELPPTLDEAIRCAVVVNILASRLTTKVSSNFDCIALSDNKLGTLQESSKSQLIKDANFIAKKWLILLREIFFASIESTLGFIEDTETEKFVKEFQKGNEKKKDTVLIIDDMYPQQKGVSKTLEQIFKSEGLKVIKCNSRAAFKKIYKDLLKNLRLVILDRRIEKRVTTDILEKINKSEIEEPIILLSRGLKESDVESFLKKGISFHISKEEIEKNPEKATELIGGILKEGDYRWNWK